MTLSLLGLGVAFRRTGWGLHEAFGEASIHLGRLAIACDWPWVAAWARECIRRQRDVELRRRIHARISDYAAGWTLKRRK